MSGRRSSADEAAELDECLLGRRPQHEQHDNVDHAPSASCASAGRGVSRKSAARPEATPTFSDHPSGGRMPVGREHHQAGGAQGRPRRGSWRPRRPAAVRGASANVAATLTTSAASARASTCGASQAEHRVAQHRRGKRCDQREPCRRSTGIAPSNAGPATIAIATGAPSTRPRRPPRPGTWSRRTCAGPRRPAARCRCARRGRRSGRRRHDELGNDQQHVDDPERGAEVARLGRVRDQRHEHDRQPEVDRGDRGGRGEREASRSRPYHSRGSSSAAGRVAAHDHGGDDEGDHADGDRHGQEGQQARRRGRRGRGSPRRSRSDLAGRRRHPAEPQLAR